MIKQSIWSGLNLMWHHARLQSHVSCSNWQRIEVFSNHQSKLLNSSYIFESLLLVALNLRTSDKNYVSDRAILLNLIFRVAYGVFSGCKFWTWYCAFRANFRLWIYSWYTSKRWTALNPAYWLPIKIRLNYWWNSRNLFTWIIFVVLNIFTISLNIIICFTS